MPGVSPEGGLPAAKVMADLYGDAVSRLLTLVAERLARGITTPGWAEQKLTEALGLRQDAARVVRALDDAAPTQVTRAVVDAYGAGARAVGGQVVATNTGAVAALADDLAGTVKATHLGMLRTTEDVYQRVVADVVGQAVTGTATRRQVAAQALDRFAAQGITRYVDAAGRSWQVESYVEMATRTATGRAHMQGGIDRWTEQGRDFVIVSEAPEECEKCRPYEGLVLTLTGRDPLPGELGEGHRYGGSLRQAMSRGLFHPNCRHNLDAYTALSRPIRPSPDPQGARDRATQRRLERDIRSAKQRLAAVEPLGDPDTTAKAKALLAARQARMRGFIAETGRRRQSHREQLGAR